MSLYIKSSTVSAYTLVQNHEEQKQIFNVPTMIYIHGHSSITSLQLCPKQSLWETCTLSQQQYIWHPLITNTLFMSIIFFLLLYIIYQFTFYPFPPNIELRFHQYFYDFKEIVYVTPSRKVRIAIVSIEKKSGF